MAYSLQLHPKRFSMKKKTLLWTAIATTAVGITVYYIKKKKAAIRQAREREDYYANISTRKAYGFGEFTL
jgi:hypothetical protein